MAECKKGLSTKLSILTFSHETISKAAYYLVVGGKLPYSTHFIIMACVMGLSQFNFFISLEQEGPMCTLALLLFSTLEQKGLM